MSTEANCLHNLERFVVAQSSEYERALRELRCERKTSHWICYIFPQVAGLGHSFTAERYAVRSKQETLAYLAHPVRGPRLLECAEVLLHHWGELIETITGFPDHLKLNSSMPLLAELSPPNSIFQQVLDVFPRGRKENRTIQFLENYST